MKLAMRYWAIYVLVGYCRSRRYPDGAVGVETTAFRKLGQEKDLGPSQNKTFSFGSTALDLPQFWAMLYAQILARS